MAIIGMFFKAGLTASAWGDWSLCTASPLGAFGNELGVQGPVGFWDPVGFTTDGNVEDCKRLRQTELKHGCVAMLATVDYITPEITGKPPWLLVSVYLYQILGRAERRGSHFKVPSAGWAQIFAYGAFCKLSQDQSPGIAARTANFGFKMPTLKHPTEKQEKVGG